MTVDWNTQIVTIPQGDLTFVSGTFYRGATNDLRILIKEKEASETGIVFPDISQHNTEVGPIVGTTYARTIEIINGYSLTFSPDSAWSVQLEGSNNNMWDVGGGILNQNNVQVIPTNAAGLVVVSGGVSIGPADIEAITDGVWDEARGTHTGGLATMSDRIDKTLTQVETNVKGTDGDTIKDISDQLDVVQTDLDNPDQYKDNIPDIVDAVWSEDLSTYNTANTAGNIVFTMIKKIINKLVPYFYAK